ncbi:MAG: hypothetical protein A2289_24035 [Deltaproteobacteria bacterium RIFOXYA12_FULL_58_15]|nr:MAG: hypothetical protein A2289_24035 [Deltaproteobacteria bacterium RIFOXYA12_FULL_58_15]OGR10044.1 MAG: hypothetical protein A2341_05365 [Deltaproteobacteria bacterium RIFOXYB12_FULL_58_9]
MATVVALGESVKAYCKGCKKVLEHAVISVTAANRPKSVKCSACDDAHAYRVKEPATRKKLGAKGVGLERRYDELTAGRDLTLGTKYGMAVQFTDDELVEHPKFGVGLVTRVCVDQKIEVVFPEGTKTLAHGR